MRLALHASLLVVLSCGVFIPPVCAEGPSALAGDTLVTEGEMVSGADPALILYELPDGSVGAVIELEIASPLALDLDLEVFDREPTPGAFVRPTCVSDSVGELESCTVERPQAGRIWLKILARQGGTSTSYRLTVKAIDPSQAAVAFATSITVLDKPIPIGVEEARFRLDLERGDLALIILEGIERTMAVRSESGSEFPSRWQPGQALVAAVGDPHRSSARLLTSLAENGTFLIEIGPADDPFGDEVSYLTVKRMTRKVSRPFLVPFSLGDVFSKPLKLSRLGQVRWPRPEPPRNESGMYVYPIELQPFSAMVSVLYDNIYDLALVDRYGRVIDVEGGSLLLSFLNPRIYRRADAIGVDLRGDDLYLAVYESTKEPPAKYRPPILRVEEVQAVIFYPD